MSDRQRVIDWMDDVLAWLREPLIAMPVNRVMAQLRVAFDVTGVCWTDQRGTVMTQMIFDPPGVLDDMAEILANFMSGEHRDRHPLTAWYDRAPSAAPQTCGRVPEGLVPRAHRAILMDPLVGLGADQQMTLYQRRDVMATSYFVLARGRCDFDDDDMLLASYVQRSLVTLDRQTRVLHGSQGPASRPRVALGLTGRELAVLQLISDGLSTRQTARRLACSPRTVEKHMQNSYRKLEVHDRVNAIRVARLAGAVEQPTTTVAGLPSPS